MSKGFTQDEYNALLHAQWMIQRKVLELVDAGLKRDDPTIQKLERDHKALGNLFVRLA
jgi:hypothetical protein